MTDEEIAAMVNVRFPRGVVTVHEIRDGKVLSDRISFWLPVAPTTNNLYVNTGHGRRKAVGYRSWLSEAGWRVREQAVQPLCGKRWGLSIAAPVNHRRDLSNCLKATEDLIVEMALIADDRWIDDIRLTRTAQGNEMLVSLWALQ